MEARRRATGASIGMEARAGPGEAQPEHRWRRSRGDDRSTSGHSSGWTLLAEALAEDALQVDGKTQLARRTLGLARPLRPANLADWLGGGFTLRWCGSVTAWKHVAMPLPDATGVARSSAGARQSALRDRRSGKARGRVESRPAGSAGDTSTSCIQAANTSSAPVHGTGTIGKARSSNGFASSA